MLHSVAFQGRPQCLEPVEWVDGLPIIGKDIDGDGIGQPVLAHKKPIDGFPVNAAPTDDEFDSGKLASQWEWNHNPRRSHWSLTERLEDQSKCSRHTGEGLPNAQ